LFNVADDQNWTWWNLGGWRNVRHGLEHCEGGSKSLLGRDVPGQIATGRWYDIRLELEGNRIRCYLDNELVHDVVYPHARTLHASAVRDSAANAVILKVVNVAPIPQTLRVDLQGFPVPREADALVLTGDPNAENSLENPCNVEPVHAQWTLDGNPFDCVFAPHSLSVIRLAP